MMQILSFANEILLLQKLSARKQYEMTSMVISYHHHKSVTPSREPVKQRHYGWCAHAALDTVTHSMVMAGSQPVAAINVTPRSDATGNPFDVVNFLRRPCYTLRQRSLRFTVNREFSCTSCVASLVPWEALCLFLVMVSVIGTNYISIRKSIIVSNFFALVCLLTPDNA